MILPGLNRPIGSSLLLDGAEGLVDGRAELPFDPFAAAQAVAVLAAERTLVLAHQRARLLRQWSASWRRRPRACRGSAAHAACRPRHARTRCRGVPCRANTSVSASVYSARCSSGTAQSSMKLTGLPSPLRLIMMLRPALRTSHRFFCGASSAHLDHAAGQAEVAHQLDQVACSLRQQRGLVAAGELHQQDGRGPADQRGLDRRAEGRVGKAQLDHRAVDQLHRGRPQLDDVLRRIHRRVEGGEVDDAQHLGARQRRELERQVLRVGQRAFGADQQVRQVHAAVGRVGLLALVVEDVEVVARDATHHLGPVRGDLARGAGVPARAHELRDVGRAHAHRADRAELHQFAIGQPGTRAQHVVHHVAVGDGARAAGVVARHAAQRGLRAGRHIHRIPQAVRLELRVQVVEHEAGLDRGGAALPRSTSSTRRKCLLLSITSAAPVVWPHWLVPPPRASTGTFRSRAMSMAVGDVALVRRHEARRRA